MTLMMPRQQIELPRFDPMLVAERALPTGQSGWSYEVKWDGHRTMVYCDGEGPASLVSREGHDVTELYPDTSTAIGEMLAGAPAVLDGEMVCIASDGRPSRELLQSRYNPYSNTLRADVPPCTFIAFDLLWYRGTKLTGWTYESRRAILSALPLSAPHVAMPPAWDDDPATALRYTRSRGLEGLVAKRRNSVYFPGARSHNWIKYKHRTL